MQMAGVVAMPNAEQASEKSYMRAVVLSSVLGWLGAHHFYLGRWAEGLLDLALSLGWVVCFALEEPLLGAFFLVSDLGHAFVVTILLLTGNFRDGEGNRVCYPGQRLGGNRMVGGTT